MKIGALLKKAVAISAALFLSFGLCGEKADAAGISDPAIPVIAIDGKELLLDVPPQIQKGRVLVPLRGIFEKFSAVVVWEPNTGAITISDSSTKIELRINSQNVLVNNEIKNLDIAPFIINGRTMIPLRFVSENLSAEVVWDAASRTVKIATASSEIGSQVVPLVVDEIPSSNSSTGRATITVLPPVPPVPPTPPTTEKPADSLAENKTFVELISDSWTVKTGQTFDVKVWVRGVADLYTLEVQMAFDPSLLKVKSLKGDFLGGTDIIKFVDKNIGTIDHVATKLGQVPGKTGDGVLTIVTFEALKEGSAEISFNGDRVQMVSSLGRFINFTEKTGSIEINITR